jgi:hypothetical protein
MSNLIFHDSSFRECHSIVFQPVYDLDTAFLIFAHSYQSTADAARRDVAEFIMMVPSQILKQKGGHLSPYKD